MENHLHHPRLGTATPDSINCWEIHLSDFSEMRCNKKKTLLWSETQLKVVDMRWGGGRGINTCRPTSQERSPRLCWASNSLMSISFSDAPLFIFMSGRPAARLKNRFPPFFMVIFGRLSKTAQKVTLTLNLKHSRGSILLFLYDSKIGDLEYQSSVFTWFYV